MRPVPVASNEYLAVRDGEPVGAEDLNVSNGPGLVHRLGRIRDVSYHLWDQQTSANWPNSQCAVWPT